MSKALKIFWDSTREDRFAFHFEFEGERYESYRNNRETMKFAADMKITAQRAGFYYITNLKQFVTTSSYRGDEASKLISKLMAQGFEIIEIGSPEAVLKAA